MYGFPLSRERQAIKSRERQAIKSRERQPQKKRQGSSPWTHPCRLLNRSASPSDAYSVSMYWYIKNEEKASALYQNMLTE